ncbi:hypothetical protein L195_g045944, partial [Trifolium pratense]
MLNQEPRPGTAGGSLLIYKKKIGRSGQNNAQRALRSLSSAILSSGGLHQHQEINSQGSIKPLKLVQIVVTVFVPAFNETFLAASACKTLSPSPGKGEQTKYQTIWVG